MSTASAPHDVQKIRPEELRDLFTNRPESTFTIVDVRTDGEYDKGHIPGAKHLPITQLPARLGELNPELDTIFHCHSGVRSRRAADMALQSGLFSGQIYDFGAGIVGWNGDTLPRKPPLKDFFDPDDTPETALRKGIELEKGAWNFYNGLLKGGPQKEVQTDEQLGKPVCSLLDRLVRAKHQQALTLYNELRSEADGELADFEDYFRDVRGEMLQSGDPVYFLSQWASVSRLDCLNSAEVALELEYRAYDLYKNMASACPRPQVEKAFTMLAHEQREIIAEIQDFMDVQA